MCSLSVSNTVSAKTALSGITRNNTPLPPKTADHQSAIQRIKNWISKSEAYFSATNNKLPYPLRKARMKEFEEKYGDTSNDHYFILRGSAGTGKSNLVRYILKEFLSNHTVYLTAPTNKAAKVVGGVTIHSFLGLRMVEDDDQMKLESGPKHQYVPRGSYVIVDEAGMLNSEITAHLDSLVQALELRVLLVGDPAQLPPVNESFSPCWRLQPDPEKRSMLNEICRFDNDLVDLTSRIRDVVRQGKGSTPLEGKGSGYKVWPSVWDWEKQFLRDTSPEYFRENKVIAWRNRTVDDYSKKIRRSFGFQEAYCVGDLLMLASPLYDKEGKVIDTIDTELTVTKVDTGTVSIDVSAVEPEGLSVKCWKLLASQEDGNERVLMVPIRNLDNLFGSYAQGIWNLDSRNRKTAWKWFWEMKRRFHAVRYAYCLTAHRAQGSTFNRVFVDQRDILSNPNFNEAFRCLYVACTRARERIDSF